MRSTNDVADDISNATRSRHAWWLRQRIGRVAARGFGMLAKDLSCPLAGGAPVLAQQQEVRMVFQFCSVGRSDISAPGDGRTWGLISMSSATAQHKFSCPACGAEAQWNPAKQELVCPYCGATSPAQIELNASGEEVIKEHDLASAMRSIPDDQRGWQAQKTSVRCQSCPGHLGLRSGARRATLRFLRFIRARALRGDQGGVPVPKACCR